MLYHRRSSVQARFYIGAGGGAIAPKPEPCPKSLVTAAVCSSKTCKMGRFWRVGVVDLVVLACVLRATTKERSSTFCLSPKYFPLEPPLLQSDLNVHFLHQPAGYGLAACFSIKARNAQTEVGRRQTSRTERSNIRRHVGQTACRQVYLQSGRSSCP